MPKLITLAATWPACTALVSATEATALPCSLTSLPAYNLASFSSNPAPKNTPLIRRSVSLESRPLIILITVGLGAPAAPLIAPLITPKLSLNLSVKSF